MKSNKQTFLRWLAFRDLYSDRAKPITRRILLSVALATAVIEMVLTLGTAIPRLQRSRLASTPLSFSIWIGNILLDNDPITDDREADLKKRLAEQLPGKERFSIHRFHSINRLGFSTATDSDSFVNQRGRSVMPKDEILKRLIAGSDPMTDEQVGIVATVDLFKNLGFSESQLPTTLHVRYDGLQQSVPVRVLAVSAVHLPYDMKFLINPSSYNDIIDIAVGEKYSICRVGPVPPDLHESANFGTGVLSEFRKRYALRGPVPKHKAGTEQVYWEFNAESPWNRNYWEKTVAVELGKLLHTAGNLDSGVFNYVEFPSVAIRKPSLDKFEAAEVRVTRLDDLIPASKACRDSGYPPNESALEQIEEIRKTSWLLAVCGILVITATISSAVINIGLILELQCQQRLPEIGMLKAMGMTSGELKVVFQRQATLICTKGCICGTLVAILPLGLLIGPLLLKSTNEGVILAQHMVGCSIVTAAGMRIVIGWSMLRATKIAISASPMETILNG